ncbi:MAG: aminoglycoside 6-adenylyltransferase [Caldilineaceae bacterium]
MQHLQQTTAVIPRLIEWAEQQTAVRTMLLTSTRTSPYATVDALSDYDVVLVVLDIHPFFDDKRWLADFGEVLVTYWDPIYLDPDYGLEKVGSVIQYADGLKIDFTLWPVELMRRIAQAPTLPPDLDVGYTILLDKDNLTTGIQAPTYTVYIPKPPTEAIYLKVVEDFFSDVPYVAKCLWRDELLPVKWCLDYDMKHLFLRPMLEWRMELDHNWSAATGNLGKGLKKQLPPPLWSALERTYVGADLEANWEALFATLALFRQVALEVAQALGYTYPLAMDQKVTLYAQKIRGMDQH